MNLIENFFYNYKDKENLNNDFLDDLNLTLKNSDLANTYENIHYYDYYISFYPLIISILLNIVSVASIHFMIKFDHKFYEGVCWFLLISSIVLLIITYKLRFFKFLITHLFFSKSERKNLESDSEDSEKNTSNILLIKNKLNDLKKENGKKLSISSNDFNDQRFNDKCENEDKTLIEEKQNVEKLSFVLINKIIIYTSAYLMNLTEVCFYHFMSFVYFKNDLGGGLAISVKLFWIIIKKINKNIYKNEFRFIVPSLCICQILSILFDIFLTMKDDKYRFRSLFNLITMIIEGTIIYIIDKYEKIKFLNSHEIKKKQDVLEGILNNLGSGLLICDLKKKILFANNKADEFIGEEYYIFNKDNNHTTVLKSTEKKNLTNVKSNIYLDKNTKVINNKSVNLINSNLDTSELKLLGNKETNVRNSININYFQTNVLRKNTLGDVNNLNLRRVSSYTGNENFKKMTKKESLLIH